MSENKEKNFEDFKQEVAVKHGFESSINIPHYTLMDILYEAVNLFSQYQREEWMKEEAERIGKIISETYLYNQGWNEALHWAAENAKSYCNGGTSSTIATIDRQSILKGLKQIDSNKEDVK